MSSVPDSHDGARPEPNVRGAQGTHPQSARSRAVLPPSLAGRVWAGLALVVGPAALLAVIEVPAQLLADRLPTAPVDRWGIPRTPLPQDHRSAWWWAACTVAAWLVLLAVRFTGPARVRRPGVWAGLVPLLYLMGGVMAGSRVGLVVENLDAERFEFIRSATSSAVQYAVAVAALILGALLTSQVIRRLPRPAPDQVRTAWVGSAPLGVPTVIGYAILAGMALTLELGGAGQLGSGATLAILVIALWHWFVGATTVAITPSGVRVTAGALRPLRYSKTVPLTQVSSVQIVHAPALLAVWATVWPRTGRCVYRSGPALRLRRLRPDGSQLRPWLLGMDSTAHAEQAAAAINHWRPAAATATTRPL